MTFEDGVTASLMLFTVVAGIGLLLEVLRWCP